MEKEIYGGLQGTFTASPVRKESSEQECQEESFSHNPRPNSLYISHNPALFTAVFSHYPQSEG